MKNLLLIIAVQFMSLQNLHAQQETVFGVEAGGGIRSWYGDKRFDEIYDPDFSFTAGLSIRHQFSRHFAVGISACYERKGVLSNVTVTDNVGNEIGDASVHYNLDYATVPLNMMVIFNSKLKPYISAGPYIGYLTNAQMKLDIHNTSSSQADQDDEYKKFDFGVSFGGGIMVPFGEQMGLSLQVRDNLGLVKVEKISSYGNSKLKNNTLHFLAGFVYRLKTENSTNRKP